MSFIPVDAEARAQALNVRTSWVVEAPAGSGKTSLLIQRYLRLLLEDAVQDPRQVLAITFTRKAVEELHSRVVTALEAAQLGDEASKDALTFDLAQQVLARDAAMGWNILASPTRLNIRTIDSLAADIVRALPVLSGGHGTLKPSKTPAVLYREAAERVLDKLGSKDAELNKALRDVLLHRDANLADVEMLLAEMLQHRDQWGRLVPLMGHTLTDAELDEHTLPELNGMLEREICEQLERVVQAVPPLLAGRIANHLHTLAKLPGYKDAENALRQHFCEAASLPGCLCTDGPAWQALARVLLVNDDARWRSKPNRGHLGIDFGAAEKSELADILQALKDEVDPEVLHGLRSLPPYPYPPEQWRIAKALFRLLRQAVVELQLIFAERGTCDFNEVTLAARSALEHGTVTEDLAASMGVRLQHLLMDEMQDTSVTQYDLLRALTHGWDGSSQTIFLVGDPKQSIYLFREANVGLFLNTIREGHFGDIPLGTLHLSQNFRSEERIVEAFNHSFKQIFVPSDTDSIPYTPAVAAKPSSGEDELRWHAEVLPSMQLDDPRLSKRAGAQRAREAAEIAIIIREWIEKPARNGRPWKIAVLVRVKKHASPIVAALRDCNIAFRAVDMESLGERQEIFDLLALTRALLNPSDRVAWLAVLHAPWCGAGAQTLHTLAAGDRSELRKTALLPHLRARAEALPPPERRRVSRTLNVLEAGLHLRGRTPLAQRVERAWRSLGGDTYLAPHELRNTERYFEMLTALDQTENVTTDEIERRIANLTAESGPADANVELLTIHKAKGLEWDVVLVPGLEKRTFNDNAPLLDWAEVSGSERVLLAPIRGKGDDPAALNQFVAEIRKRKARAEVKRLLYVAATRARVALHLFGTLQATSNGTFQPEKSTLLHAAWESARDHFTSSGPLQESGAIDTLQASEEPIAPRPAIIERIPLDFDPVARFHLNTSALPLTASAETQAHFSRPEGSFAARAMGDTAHVFMEQVALRLSEEGTSVAALLQALPTWSGRVETYARSHGLDSTEATRIAKRVLQMLEGSLQSELGVWLLSPRAGAASEKAFAASFGGEIAAAVRMDRTFLAGGAPLSAGETHRWIVDFKTAEASADVETFLEEERVRYEGQLLAYARSMRASDEDSLPIVLALYYPSINRLVYWHHAL